ncbi:uncharacterized protein PV07_12873, partial [Cladophialophora immunda]
MSSIHREQNFCECLNYYVRARGPDDVRVTTAGGSGILAPGTHSRRRDVRADGHLEETGGIIQLVSLPAGLPHRIILVHPDLLSTFGYSRGQSLGTLGDPDFYLQLADWLLACLPILSGSIPQKGAIVRIEIIDGEETMAPSPASGEATLSLEKKMVDGDMLGKEGKAECSICMVNVELGSEVTVLPCNHWFHGDCVTRWLKQRDSCPHCRKPITKPEDR